MTNEEKGILADNLGSDLNAELASKFTPSWKKGFFTAWQCFFIGVPFYSN